MLSLPHRPAQPSQDGIPTSPSFPGPESYYSAQDIEILHHVVVTAQETLKTLPEGERLATNSLFRAYDLVLPQYGIDPEQDHHLSRLVFRVGGERGNGSLFDKFKAVLARMGIELEVEAGSTANSVQLSDNDLHSRPQIERRESASIEQDHAASDTSPAQAHVTHGSPPGLGGFQKPQKHQGHSTESIHGVIEQSAHAVHDASEAVTQPAGREVFDSAAAQPAKGTHFPIPGKGGTGTAQAELAVAPTRHSILPRGAQNKQPSWLGFQRDPCSPSAPLSEPIVPPASSLDGLARYSFDDHSILERRASRAWGLFQLTKAVSHWNVWAEEKSDRAKVARRHMTRYRHFGSWHSKTVDAKHYSRRLLLAWIQNTWRDTINQSDEHGASARTRLANASLCQSLDSWTSCISVQPDSQLLHFTSTRLGGSITQWRTFTSQLQESKRQAEQLLQGEAMNAVVASWRDLSKMSQDALLHERQLQLQEVFWLWELVLRSRRFETTLRNWGVRSIIAHWHNIEQTRSPAQHHTFHDRQGAEIRIRRLQSPDALAVKQRYNLLAQSLANWRVSTVDAVTTSRRAERFSSVLTTHHMMPCWQVLSHGTDELQLWASRADRYLAINACLQRARQVARPAWSHTTRTLYARARWRQKQLNVRRMLSAWKRQVRANEQSDGAARDSEIDISARRLIQSLHSWQEECQALLTSEWSSHLPSSWLNEWSVSDESLRLLRDEAAAAWGAFLKFRIYNKWRALSVQFHSQIYVVADVSEKNSRKLTRYILLHWRQSGLGVAPLSASRTTSRSTYRPGTSLWSRTQTRPTAASSLIEFGARTWPDRVEEAQEQSPIFDVADHQGILNTPTRWTGLGTSLTRLPTTTPLTTLSTPFERELRGRYNQSLGSTLNVQPLQNSTRHTPRLSAAEARRIAEERRRKRPP